MEHAAHPCSGCVDRDGRGQESNDEEAEVYTLYLYAGKIRMPSAFRVYSLLDNIPIYFTRSKLSICLTI